MKLFHAFPISFPIIPCSRLDLLRALPTVIFFEIMMDGKSIVQAVNHLAIIYCTLQLRNRNFQSIFTFSL